MFLLSNKALTGAIRKATRIRCLMAVVESYGTKRGLHRDGRPKQAENGTRV